jgi:FMN phosphatase YigB (HAD superfamily)
MRIGIDFDNTLVSYDTLFHRVALEQELIPADLPQTKVAVRDYLRSVGREPAWTEMQGTVYGARMDEAQAYPGAIDFLRWAGKQRIELCIISHKTRHPFIGPRHDLHKAARLWVEHHLADVPRPLVYPENVFFELTKEAKLRRIADCGCGYYIDDLPEILLAPAFPGGVQRILFDPDSHHAARPPVLHVRGWEELRDYFARECLSTP